MSRGSFFDSRLHRDDAASFGLAPFLSLSEAEQLREAELIMRNLVALEPATEWDSVVLKQARWWLSMRDSAKR